MAQLKDTVVSGSLRATDTLFATTIQTPIIKAPSASNSVTYTAGTNGQILKSNGSSVYWAADNNSGGTVTSITIAATSPVAVDTAGAITTSGTRTISLANAYGDTKNPYGTKTANYVLAGPASGAAAAPTFRALVAADIPSLTKAKISDFPTSMTPTSHAHGNIQNGGTLQTNDITIANGDKLVVTDSSDSSKVARTSISFDASTETQCLTKKGTWETFGTSNLTIGTTATTAAAGNHTHSYLPLSGGTMTGAINFNSKGNCSIYNGPNDQAGALGGTLNNLVISSWNGVSFTTSCTNQTYTGTNAVTINCRTGVLSAAQVYNAVWNDYAEFRKTNHKVKYGQVVVDKDDGSLAITERRLQPGAQVVSDTWGHIMGETDDAKTPIAVAGRVLVYPYQDRSKYHAGMSVCSAPNGTVDIMTRDEIVWYPDAIVGIVSEIPDYDTWGSGNVKVDGRIWIKVR